MAVVIDQVDAVMEGEQTPAPPSPAPSAAPAAPAVDTKLLRAAMGRLREREARLRAD